jgi:hypothetical protein
LPTEASTSSLTPVTKCQKCGGTTIEFAAFAKADLNDQLTGPNCGHRAAKSEFTAELVKKVMEPLHDAFRDIPGFKQK